MKERRGYCRKLAGVALLLAGPLLPAAPAAAQTTASSIRGVVVDASGPLAEATVEAVGKESGFRFTAKSGPDGSFALAGLAPGVYTITVSSPAYAAQSQDVQVLVGQDVEASFVLSPSGVFTESVTVVGEAVQLLVETRTSEISTNVTQQQIEALPLNNRNFMQLVTLVPGVTSSGSSEIGIGLTNVVDLSINGTRRNAVNWLVDGVSNTDVGSSITLLSVPTVDSIQEFRVITSLPTAEFGRSAGGVVNLVTRGGTRDIHGGLYEFWRNDKLNANSFFGNAAGRHCDRGETPPLGKSCGEERSPRAKLRYNNFGYNVGGPIYIPKLYEQRDKTFFFFSQEWRKISRAPTSTLATVVDPAWLNDPSNPNYVAPENRDPNAVRLLAAWPAANFGVNSYQDSRPNDQDTRQEVLRMDYQMGAKSRLMGRYTHDLSETTETGGLFFNTTIPNIATTQTKVPGHIFVAQLTTTLSSTKSAPVRMRSITTGGPIDWAS